MKNACIYDCRVMHNRFRPKQNHFQYRVFMFSFDLDEIQEVVKKIPFISLNRLNLFSFRDKDHYRICGGKNASLKSRLLSLLENDGVDINRIKRVQLVTNLCTFGYQFNPVSFYYCYDETESPVCSVAEVSNTYREMKMFLLKPETLEGDEFKSLQTKNFYVSPFIELDAHFDFHLGIPADKIYIRIDDYAAGSRFFTSSLQGEKKPLTSLNVLKYAIRFPMIPLQIMGLIHWQALKLWLKNIKHHKKKANKHLQLDVIKPT